MNVWRRLVRTLVVVCVLAGVGVSCWPVVEAVLAQHHGAVQGAASAAPDRARFQAAGRYNAGLAAGAADPWSDEQAASGADHDRYLAALGGGAGPIGRVVIPAIGVDMPIWADATRASLAKGAGHMYGSSLPVGGPGTHAVLAGHTGFVNRLYFDRLPNLVDGDVFFVDSAAGRLAYRVDRRTVVDPSDVSAVQPVPGEDHVTLVTCVESGTRRLLVRGVRTTIPPDRPVPVPVPVPDVVAGAVQVATYDWAWPRLGVGLAGLVVAGAIVAQPRRD